MEIRKMEKVDIRKEKPLYLQVKQSIIKLIENMDCKGNGLLPSENELKEFHNVSAGTVKRALWELEQEGYIYRRQGKGTFAVPKHERKKSPVFIKLIFLFSSLSKDDFFDMELIDGIKHYLQGHMQYEVSIDFVKKGTEIVESIKASSSKGIIVPLRTEKDIILVEGISIPVVVLQMSYNGKNNKVGSVKIDNVGGSYKAVSYLLKNGYRKIGFLIYPKSISSKERFVGYRQALSDYRIPFREELVAESLYVRESAYLSTKTLLRNNPDLDSIFAPGYYMDLGAIDAIKEDGRKIPDDIAVVGFDYPINFPDIMKSDIVLTTVKQPVFKMGEVAAEMLINMIEGRPVKNRNIVLPTELIKGESVLEKRGVKVGR